MQIDKRNVGKNCVLGNWLYFLKDGGGIHGKIKNWKDGDPEREPAFAHVFRQEIEPGMVLFDIGANIGYYSLIAAQKMQGDGSIFALEPDPRNAFLLRKAVKFNGYGMIKVHEVAASKKNTRGLLHLSKATNLSSMAKTEHTTETVEVEVVTLSSFAWRKRIVGVGGGVFIRMDIEGHEVEALEGAMTFLKKGFPCKIFMEVHPQFYNSDHNMERKLNQLLKLGFTTKYVISAAVSQPMAFAQLGYSPDKVFDCGRFTRGLYSKVSDEDMVELTSEPLREYFDDDMIARSGERHTDKVVRSILLERR